MSCKTVLIGGGSTHWVPTLSVDLFLREGLRGGRLVLADPDEHALDLMRQYCSKAADKIGSGWSVETAALEPALDGADVVCASISVGGLDALSLDYHIPEEFGVYHCVADTVGPGGISRTLRSVPVFLDIAAKMQRYCPRAWLVHVTNPLNQITLAVARETPIRCVGLCHNYTGTMLFLSRFLGVKPEDVDAISIGVNHGSWLKDLTVHGEPVDPRRLTPGNYLRFEAEQRVPDQTKTTDDALEAMSANEDSPSKHRLSFELFELFGFFPVGASAHVAENFPYYLNDLETIRRHRIWRKGVLPGRAEAKNRALERVEKIVAGRRPLDEFQLSLEQLSSVVESLWTGKPFRAVVTMQNQGQIPNLPRGAPVETWARIGRDTIEPEDSGGAPGAILGVLGPVIAEMELAVEAAVTGDRAKVVQAMFVSPMLQRKDEAAELADRLIKAHSRYLPQFRLERTMS